MNKIANYDTLDYDYSTYWRKRDYEHNCEVILLNKLFKNRKGNWFLDMGGSYGRLTSTYYSLYKHPIIIDYSLKTLQKNYIGIKKHFPNLELISANAYNLPFKENTFDGGLMVRVLHHIERPKEYFKEIYRLLSPNSIYIQEYANKLHVKAILRAILHLDFSLFTIEPYQQPNRNNYEGASKKAYVPFFNFHTKWITKELVDTGFNIEKKYGSSFLRLNILKRIFNTKLLIFKENILQDTISFLNISPSIFIKTSVNKKDTKRKSVERLEDILVCPVCKNDLVITNVKATCLKCKKEYYKEKNIWDFRV